MALSNPIINFCSSFTFSGVLALSVRVHCWEYMQISLLSKMYRAKIIGSTGKFVQTFLALNEYLCLWFFVCTQCAVEYHAQV